MDQPKRSWTVDEANAALPWVGKVVDRAQDLWADFRAQATTSLRMVRQNGHGVVPADPAPVKECLEELAEQSIVLRDIERGLIDFPAQAKDGSWYWLCWLQGEGDVAWWHWPDDGFAGRAPLRDLPE